MFTIKVTLQMPQTKQSNRMSNHYSSCDNVKYITNLIGTNSLKPKGSKILKLKLNSDRSNSSNTSTSNNTATQITVTRAAVKNQSDEK